MKQKAGQYYVLAFINMLFFICFLITNGLNTLPVIALGTAGTATTNIPVESTKLPPETISNPETTFMESTTPIGTTTTTIPITESPTTKPPTKPTTSNTTTKKPGGTTSYIPGKPSVSVGGGDGTVPLTGSIAIQKSDIASKRPIANCVFSITGNGITKSVTTDSNGTCSFSGLKIGTYTIKEISGPAEYENITSQQIVQLNQYSMNPSVVSYSRKR